MLMSEYVTGMENPPNSTILPPLETWKSYSCVLLGVAALLPLLYRTFLHTIGGRQVEDGDGRLSYVEVALEVVDRCLVETCTALRGKVSK